MICITQLTVATSATVNSNILWIRRLLPKNRYQKTYGIKNITALYLKAAARSPRSSANSALVIPHPGQGIPNKTLNTQGIPRRPIIKYAIPKYSMKSSNKQIFFCFELSLSIIRPIRADHSASFVVVLAHKVSSFEELVHVNEGSYENHRAENVPKPVVCAGEFVIDTSSRKLRTDPVGDLMRPNDAGDAAGEGVDKEEEQAVVHGLLSVITACDGIDVAAYG